MIDAESGTIGQPQLDLFENGVKVLPMNFMLHRWPVSAWVQFNGRPAFLSATGVLNSEIGSKRDRLSHLPINHMATALRNQTTTKQRRAYAEGITLFGDATITVDRREYIQTGDHLESMNGETELFAEDLLTSNVVIHEYHNRPKAILFLQDIHDDDIILMKLRYPAF